MKTKFTFLCCLAMVWCASLAAQTEFSKTGTCWYVPYWYYRWLGPHYSNSKTNCYYLGDDTLLAGQTWKKLYVNERLCGAFREQESKVWFTPLDEYVESEYAPRLLYDFSMQAGDKFYRTEYDEVGMFRNAEEAAALGLSLDGMEEMVVKYVDTIGGRRVLTIARSSRLADEEKWIEGIGSEESFFEHWRPRPTDGSSSLQYLLHVVSDDGKTLYFNGEIADGKSPSMLSEDMKWYESSGQGPVVRSPENKGIEGSFTLSSMSLQEINGKIYYLEGDGYPHYPEVVELLYDFTLQEGDFVAVLKSWEWITQTEYWPPRVTLDTLYVEKVDLVVYEGVKRKRLFLVGKDDDVWVEGIGSLNGWDMFLPWRQIEDGKEIAGRLTCCYRGDECLYLHPDYWDCTTLKGESVRSAKSGLLDVRVSDGTAAFYWTGSRRADRLYVYAADGGKVADIRMNGGTVEIRGLKPGIYYYRLELKDTEEAVAGKLLVR